MATTIVTKNGSGAPAASDLVAGELAVDLTNGRLYTEDSGGSVIEIGLNPSGNVDVTGTVTADKLITDSGVDAASFTSTGSTYVDINNGTVTGRLQTISSDFFIGTATVGTSLAFKSGNNVEAMRISSTGNVGIGTDSPFFTTAGRVSLSVNGTSSSILAFGKGGSSENYLLADAGGFTIANTSATLPTTFFNNGAERMSIDSSGSVGIGITPKTTNATVTGSFNVNQAGLLVRNSNQAYFASNIYWDASDQLKSYAAGYGLASLFVPSDGSHRFFNTTAAATGADQNLTLNETMRITSGGNVGIGTASPTSMLSVGSTSTATGDVTLRTTKTTFSMTPSNTDAGGIDLNLGWVAGGQGPMKFSIGSERMRIDANGNVTIGSSTLSADAALKFQADTGTFTLNHDRGAHALVLSDSDGTGEILRVDTSGNLLVGKTSPNSSLTGVQILPEGDVGVTRDGSHALLLNRLTSDGDIALFRKAGTTVGSIGTNSSRLTIGSGDTGLLIAGDLDNITPFNTSTNASRDASVDLGNSGVRFKDLYLSGVMAAGNGSATAPSVRGTDTNTGLFFPSGGVTAITRNGVEAMRITSAGDLYYGQTSGSISDVGTILQANGRNFFMASTTSEAVMHTYNNTSSSGAKYKISFKQNGTQVGVIEVGTSSTGYLTSSDYRLKENVVAMSGATERLKQLKPSRFNFIADADTTVDGFLAHEVQDIVPEAISGTKDAVDADGNPEYQGIDQSKLVPLLVATIQELEARIAALES